MVSKCNEIDCTAAILAYRCLYDSLLSGVEIHELNDAKPKLWLSPPHMGGDELELVKEAFASNWIAPLGPHVTAFENELCQVTGAGYAAALSSGTAAIHLALILLGIGAGDEVICASFTFSASTNPIVYQGARPVFVDSKADTWNMNPELLEQTIKDRLRLGAKPKAIVIVHLYGMPALMDRIMEIANRYEIPVVEDAAEALGASYRGKALGSFGHFGILSFNGNKIITTSGGGALLSDDRVLIERARNLSEQARDPAPHYQHSQIGYNYRLSNICAAIGRGQLRVLPQRVAQKRALFDRYQELLGDLPGVAFQPEPQGCSANRWLSCITIDPQQSGGVTREEVRLAFAAANIDCRPLWKPMHLQPIFQHSPYYGDGTSERLFDQGLCLPSGTAMSADDLARVVSVFRGCFGK